MTKIVQLRVSVPVDDGVRVERVQAELRTMIREKGIAILDVPLVPESTLPLEGAEIQAIFWPAADVKQGPPTNIKRNGDKA